MACLRCQKSCASLLLRAHFPFVFAVGERPGYTVAFRQSCWGCAGSAVAGFVGGGGNLSHFSGASCVSESGQVAVEFCSGYQGKCFHVDLFILLLFFLLSHQGSLWEHHRTWYTLAKVEFRGFILVFLIQLFFFPFPLQILWKYNTLSL